jgi:hypothetical protein
MRARGAATPMRFMGIDASPRFAWICGPRLLPLLLPVLQTIRDLQMPSGPCEADADTPKSGCEMRAGAARGNEEPLGSNAFDVGFATAMVAPYSPSPAVD